MTGRLDIVGAGIAVITLATATLTLTEAPARGWGDPLILATAAVAATAASGYLDVSLPERPVLALNPQVGG